MNLTFAAQLNKMITAGLGGAVEAPETGVAVGRKVEYTSIGPAPILTFEANSELPLKALSVNMEPIQEGIGDPSPENIRPISGRSEVNVWREATYDTSADPVITIQLGDIIYGGTVDVLSGVLTVDREIVTYNGSETWRGNVTTGVYCVNNAVKRATNYSGMIICDKLPTGTKTDSTRERPFITAYSIPNIYPGLNWIYLLFPRDQYSSWADVTAWLAENPIQVCYELAQPFTITLTPEQLTTVLGQNNVWSDADKVSLTYGNIYYTEGY